MAAWVEILDGHGRVRERQRVAVADEGGGFVIGRGAAADVVIDDSYAAALHARIDVDGNGATRVSDLGSANGLVIGGKRQHGVEGALLADGMLTVGRTRLRIRTHAETLAPERRDNGEERGADQHALRWAVAGGAVCALFAIYTGWVGAPQDVAATIAYSMISWTLGAFAWVAAWAFLSRVVLGEWRWLRHAGTFLGVLGALIVLDIVLDILWFAFALPYIPAWETVILVATAGILLYWHLTHASQVSVRAALVASIALPAVVGGVSHLLLARNQARDVNYIAMDSRLFPPAMRLRGAGDVAKYFDGAAGMKAEADRRRRMLPNENGEEDDVGDF